MSDDVNRLANMSAEERLQAQKLLLEAVELNVSRLRQLTQFQVGVEGVAPFDINQPGSSESERRLWSAGYADGIMSVLRWLTDPEYWLTDVETDSLAISLGLLNDAVEFYRAAVSEHGSFDDVLTAHRAQKNSVNWDKNFLPFQKAHILGELNGFTMEQVDATTVLLTDGWDDSYESLVRVVKGLTQ